MRTPIHEVIHAIGFFHTHSRIDRDNFVIIHEQNIIPSKRSQFYKASNTSNQIRDYGTYDYNSIMHYSSRTASASGLPTITKTDSTTIDRNTSLSSLDIESIKSFFDESIRYDDKEFWLHEYLYDYYVYRFTHPAMFAGIQVTGSFAQQHWLEQGRELGIRASKAFDPHFYLAANPQIHHELETVNSRNAAIHWIHHGMIVG